MDAFFWGVVTGAAVTPFAWAGLKWCYAKYIELLNRN